LTPSRQRVWRDQRAERHHSTLTTMLFSRFFCRRQKRRRGRAPSAVGSYPISTCYSESVAADDRFPDLRQSPYSRRETLYHRRNACQARVCESFWCSRNAVRWRPPKPPRAIPRGRNGFGRQRAAEAGRAWRCLRSGVETAQRL
jgi:hypothetical protein